LPSLHECASGPAYCIYRHLALLADPGRLRSETRLLPCTACSCPACRSGHSHTPCMSAVTASGKLFSTLPGHLARSPTSGRAQLSDISDTESVCHPQCPVCLQAEIQKKDVILRGISARIGGDATGVRSPAPRAARATIPDAAPVSNKKRRRQERAKRQDDDPDSDLEEDKPVYVPHSVCL
jgi:hypothetical protein